MTVRVSGPVDAPVGHKGWCCSSCIEDSNLGYGDLHPLCCCLDKRPYDVADREYSAWRRAISEDYEAVWNARTRHNEAES